MEYTLASSIKPEIVIAPQEITVEKAGDVIDSKDFGSISFICSVGTTGNGVTFSIKECDTANGNFENVSAEFLISNDNTFTSTSANKVVWFGYFGKKRYVKVHASPDGASNVSVVAVLSHPEMTPTLGENAGKQFENYG